MNSMATMHSYLPISFAGARHSSRWIRTVPLSKSLPRLDTLMALLLRDKLTQLRKALDLLEAASLSSAHSFILARIT